MQLNIMVHIATTGKLLDFGVIRICKNSNKIIEANWKFFVTGQCWHSARCSDYHHVCNTIGSTYEDRLLGTSWWIFFLLPDTFFFTINVFQHKW